MRFVCDHCDQVLKVSTDKVGRRGKCPSCRQPIAVPTQLEAAAALERHRASEPADTSDSDNPFAEFTVYDIDTELIYDRDGEARKESRRSKVDYGKVAVPRSVLYMQGILQGLGWIAAFTLGVLVGLNAASVAEPQQPVAQLCVVSGRVSYADRGDRQKPDDGAVVILLPKDAKPEKRVEPFGLRPQDEYPDDDHPALWTIREIGGDYGRCDEEGRYRLRVKNQRAYYVLVVSTRMNRQDQDFDRSFLAKIGAYFYPATELVGSNEYHWDEVATLRSTEKRLNDVVFGN